MQIRILFSTYFIFATQTDFYVTFHYEEVTFFPTFYAKLVRHLTFGRGCSLDSLGVGGGTGAVLFGNGGGDVTTISEWWRIFQRFSLHISRRFQYEVIHLFGPHLSVSY